MGFLFVIWLSVVPAYSDVDLTTERAVVELGLENGVLTKMVERQFDRVLADSVLARRAAVAETRTLPATLAYVQPREGTSTIRLQFDFQTGHEACW